VSFGAYPGRHRKLATKVKLIVEGDHAVYAYRGPDSVSTGLEESPRLGLLNLDGTAGGLARTGLPAEYSPRLSFSNSEDGFARIEKKTARSPRGGRTARRSTASTSAPTVAKAGCRRHDRRYAAPTSPVLTLSLNRPYSTSHPGALSTVPPPEPPTIPEI
jgi:hypothetical protein